MTSEPNRTRSLLSAALALVLALARCTSHRDGTSLELSVADARLTGDERTSRGDVFQTDTGERVTLESAYAVLGRIELLPCAEAGVWPKLRDWFGISIAHAHGISTPTVWAATQVIDLNDAGQRVISVGRMQPLPGEYCSVRVTIDQADVDAEGAQSDPWMVGRSILLQGRFRSAGDGAEHPFRYFTALSDHLDLPFVDADGDAARVTLSAEHLNEELRIEIDRAALFEDIAWTDGEYEPNAATAVDNLLRRARAVVGPS